MDNNPVVIMDEFSTLTEQQQQDLLDALADEPEPDVSQVTAADFPRLQLPGDDIVVAMQPTHCPHGVYIAKGDTTAQYCTACNPGSGRIIVATRHIPEVKHAERELDAAEYMELPLHARLTAGSAWLEA